MTLYTKEYTAMADWSQSVPEVVGTPEQIAYCCTVYPQRETTPPPKCKENLYMTLEWLHHWKKVFNAMFIRIPAEDFRQECMRIIRKRLQKNPAPAATGNGIKK